MRYCPPMIFAHRVLYERDEQEVAHSKIRELFGQGGSVPDLESRWMVGRVAPTDLEKWEVADTCYGHYVGFRTRDDQFLFYMTFQGTTR